MASTIHPHGTLHHPAPESATGGRLLFMLGVWGLVIAFLLAVLFGLPLLD